MVYKNIKPSHTNWSIIPKPNKRPAPFISNNNPTPPNASNIAGGLFAIIFTIVFIILSTSFSAHSSC